jgi:recombinational DNA repair ATPase RecF
LVGPNGIGKTNVVEAIHYLSLALRFGLRTTFAGQTRQTFAASGHDPNPRQRTSVAIAWGRRQEILVNDRPSLRLSELSELVNVIGSNPGRASVR